MTSVLERSSYTHDETLSVDCTRIVGAENVTLQYFDANGDLYSQAGGVCNANIDPNGFFEQNIPGLVDGVENVVVTFTDSLGNTVLSTQLCAVESLNTSFLSCTEPADLLASVTRGVQDTAAPLWFLGAFLGIGIAFYIASRVIILLFNSLDIYKSEKEKTDSLDSPKRTEDFIYHSPADLEFKREYGQNR
jgi:hypothetical protein